MCLHIWAYLCLYLTNAQHYGTRKFINVNSRTPRICWKKLFMAFFHFHSNVSLYLDNCNGSRCFLPDHSISHASWTPSNPIYGAIKLYRLQIQLSDGASFPNGIRHHLHGNHTLRLVKHSTRFAWWLPEMPFWTLRLQRDGWQDRETQVARSTNFNMQPIQFHLFLFLCLLDDEQRCQKLVHMYTLCNLCTDKVSSGGNVSELYSEGAWLDF
jgi:hypothetical protein